MRIPWATRREKTIRLLSPCAFPLENKTSVIQNWTLWLFPVNVAFLRWPSPLFLTLPAVPSTDLIPPYQAYANFAKDHAIRKRSCPEEVQRKDSRDYQRRSERTFLYLWEDCLLRARYTKPYVPSPILPTNSYCCSHSGRERCLLAPSATMEKQAATTILLCYN